MYCTDRFHMLGNNSGHSNLFPKIVKFHYKKDSLGSGDMCSSNYNIRDAQMWRVIEMRDVMHTIK